MANVLVNEQHLSDIAAAIRAKLGVQTTYKPGQMAAAIGSIPTGEAVSFPLDCTIFSVYRESSMSVALTGEMVKTVWGGSSAIGAMMVFSYAIPATVKSISYRLSTGNSYSVTNNRFKHAVGLAATRPTSVIDSDAPFLAANICATRNMEETEFTLNCAAVDQVSYLVVLAHGWSAELKNITLHF